MYFRKRGGVEGTWYVGSSVLVCADVLHELFVFPEGSDIRLTLSVKPDDDAVVVERDQDKYSPSHIYLFDGVYYGITLGTRRVLDKQKSKVYLNLYYWE